MFELPLLIYDMLTFAAIVIFSAGIFGFIYERFWGECRRQIILMILGVYVIAIPMSLGIVLIVFTTAV